MKIWGYWLIAIGAIVALGALVLLNTTVDTTSPSALGYALTDRPQVHNLGLLQRRELIFQSGSALFLAGAIFIGAGTIVDTVRGAFPIRGAPVSEPTGGATVHSAADPQIVPAQDNPGRLGTAEGNRGATETADHRGNADAHLILGAGVLLAIVGFIAALFAGYI